MRALIALLFVLLILPSPAAATNLSTAAGNLAVGQFVEFTGTTGFPGILLPPGCTGNNEITQFANTAVWNPIAKRFQFSGSSHAPCSGSNERSIYYDDATNSWGDLPSACPGCNDPRHSYGHNAMNPATGEHYYTNYFSPANLRLSNGAGSWTSLATPSVNFQQCCRGQAFFPDRGTLIRIEPQDGVHEYSPSSNTWTKRALGSAGGGGGLPQVLSGGADQPAWGVYSSRAQAVVFGSGPIWKYNANGTFTQITGGGPGSVQCCTGINSQISVDPVTGMVLVLKGSTLWELDPGTTAASTGSWRNTGVSVPAALVNSSQDGAGAGAAVDVISAPVSTYGVVMYVKGENSNHIYLYKHASSGPVNPTLTVTKAGVGSGTVTSNPLGIDCGATCSAQFTTGASVTLTAAQAAGSTFTGWSGGCSGTAITCNVVLNSSTTVTATFTATSFTMTVTKAGTGTGTVSSAPAGIDCGASCAAAFASGTPVTLTVVPNVGSTFVAFSGDCVGATCNVTMNQARNVTATFNVSGGISADQDFVNRCNAALATGGRCFHFDDVSQIPTANGQDCWGCNFGAFAPGQNMPVIDASVKTSGAGSLKFVTPALSGSSGGGSWFTNLSNPASTWQIGPGDDLWVQYRYMPSAATLSLANSNVPIASSPGFKLSHVGDGDTPACNTGTGKSNANCPGSCSDMEVVVQPNWDSTGGNRLGAYTTCNNGTVGQPIMTVTRDGGATYDRHPNWTGTPARSCNYPGPYNEPKCFAFRPNEWHTIKYHIHVNAWNTWTNTIQIWAGHQGEPLQLLINCAPGVTCSDNNNANVQGFFLYNSDTALYKMGKIWLDPYVTRQGVDAPGPLAPTTAWFDELIMSKQDIADPGSAALPAQPPAAPTNLVITSAAPPVNPPVLTVTKTGAGSGTVTSADTLINCGPTCSSPYADGAQVTLTATSGNLTGWSGGGCSGTGTCVTTLHANTTVTATFGAAVQQFALEWDGTGSARRMLYWNNPPPAYPMTYVFRAFPRKKTFVSGECPNQRTGYYTMFFWGNNGNFAWNAGGSGRFYGMHPYPGVPFNPPCAAGTWEASLISGDWFFPPFPNQTEVAWDRWYTQVIRVQETSPNNWHYEFYFDWPDQTKVISQNVSGSDGGNPPNPAIVIGQAPDACGPPPCSTNTSWGGYPGWEEYNGRIRGIQIYTQYLSLTDIATEITAPKSSAAGLASIWYLNLEPRPTDVTDKKATGTIHNPQFACPGIQSTCSSITEWTGP